MVDVVKIFMGDFILGTQTSEGVLGILSQECCKNKFCAFLSKHNFPFKFIPISKNTPFVKEFRNYILPFICVRSFIILIRFIEVCILSLLFWKTAFSSFCVFYLFCLLNTMSYLQNYNIYRISSNKHQVSNNRSSLISTAALTLTSK